MNMNIAAQFWSRLCGLRAGGLEITHATGATVLLRAWHRGARRSQALVSKSLQQPAKICSICSTP